MPKRALAAEPSAEDSDLSSVAEDVLNVEQPQTNVNGSKETNRPRKRRKGLGTPPAGKKTNDAHKVPGDAAGSTVITTPKARKGRAKVKAEVKVEEGREESSPLPTPKKARKVKSEDPGEDKGNVEPSEEGLKRKRKSKAEKEADLVDMALAARTTGHKLYIGAHVSSSGGVQHSVLNSIHIGANAFALFLGSNQRWVKPPMTEEHVNMFQARCTHHGFDQARHVVPHGSYLVNLAHTDKTRIDQAYGAFVDDLKRCERLGIKLYNFHPGNNQCGDRPRAIAQIAESINRAHAETSSVITLLENMAKGGNVIGSTFEDLRDTIALVNDKARVGVCLDTCHTFAAGYDLRTPTAYTETMDHFEEVVGFGYLRALHLNDSKAPFASCKDLHANIGTGFLGLRAFHNVVNDPRLVGLPLVLETPIDVRDDEGKYVKDDKGKQKEDKGIWAREIKLLESMVGMDADGEKFTTLEEQLAKIGTLERQRLTEQVERKKVRDEKKANGARKKKVIGKKGAALDGEESSLSELSEEG